MPAAAILPVKRFDAAKQRLSGDLPPNMRAELAEAMVADVLAALSRAEEIALTVVVSGAVEEPAGEHVVVVTDALDAGQSPAALAGMERAAALGYESAVLVPGDCPLLDPAELDALVREAAEQDVVIVPDRHGTGTNALALDPRGPFRPSFGPGSLERHTEQAHERNFDFTVREVPSLALDLDTPDDLTALRAALAQTPERAAKTRAALARIKQRLTAAS
jgi:2-phospho-L-lactate/phosphoenolpyruvate guanylyltransferase